MIRNSSVTATPARHKARDKLLDLGGANAVSDAVERFQQIVMAVRKVDKEDSQLFLSYNGFRLLQSENRTFNSNRNAFFSKGRLANSLNVISNTRKWFLFERKAYQRQGHRK